MPPSLLCCCNKYSPCLSVLGPDPKPKLRGDARTFRVWLDPNQYQQDMTSSIQSNTEDPYETFNIIMRRKPKENNFKVWIALHRVWVLYLQTLSSGPTNTTQSDVSHILCSLGYCIFEVGARAALRLPTTQGPRWSQWETLLTGYSCDIYAHLSHLKESPCGNNTVLYCYASCMKACYFIILEYRCPRLNPAVKGG